MRALTLGKLLSAFGEALFEASGGRTPAGFDNLRTLSFWGHDEKGGFHLLREALGAGAGARMEGDGASAVPPLGATGGMPVEVMEARYPVRVESMGLAQDSGGAGARRGGLGVFREYRMLIDGVSASAAGSAEAGPAGGTGASPGKPYEMRRRSGKKSVGAPAVGASTAFSKGDSIRVSTPGGGGWGDPVGRDARGRAGRRSARLRLRKGGGGCLRRGSGRRAGLPCRRGRNPKAQAGKIIFGNYIHDSIAGFRVVDSKRSDVITPPLRGSSIRRGMPDEKVPSRSEFTTASSRVGA